MRSDSYTLPGQEDSDHPDLTAFASYTGIEGHARLARGRWPRPRAPGNGEVEAVLPSAAARLIRADVGDVVTLRGRIDTGQVVRVRVVGLFGATRPDEYFWQGDRLITTGVERLDYTTYGPFVVRPEVFASRFTATGADVRWTVLPDLRNVDSGEIGPLGDRVAAGGLPDSGPAPFTVVAALPAGVLGPLPATPLLRFAGRVPAVRA